jgi:hypothetical protein
MALTDSSLGLLSQPLGWLWIPRSVPLRTNIHARTEYLIAQPAKFCSPPGYLA